MTRKNRLYWIFIIFFIAGLFFGPVFADFKSDFYKGQEAFKIKKYTIASHFFNRALTQNQKSEVSRYYLAITQAYLKQYDNARNNYQWLVDNGNNSQIKKLAGEGLVYLPQKRKVATSLKPILKNTNIDKNSYEELTYRKLAEYKYDWRKRNPPPPAIKSLENRKFHIKGYMIPIQGGEYFNKFMLVSVVPECFFCTPPDANQVIQVELNSGKTNYVNNKILNIYGKLKIGQIDDPYIACVYALDADYMEVGN